MDNETKAKLSVVLTALLEATRAKNNLSKAALALGQGGDVEAIIGLMEAAFGDLEKAVEEARVFRNMLRDDRSKAVKNRQQWAKRGPSSLTPYHSDREMPRSEQDPKDVLGRIVKSMG